MLAFNKMNLKNQLKLTLREVKALPTTVEARNVKRLLDSNNINDGIQQNLKLQHSSAQMQNRNVRLKSVKTEFIRLIISIGRIQVRSYQFPYHAELLIEFPQENGKLQNQLRAISAPNIEKKIIDEIMDCQSTRTGKFC